MKKAIISLFVLFASVSIYAGPINQTDSIFEEISLIQCHHYPWEDASHPIKKLPGTSVTPPSDQFCQDKSELRFTGVEDFSSFTYYIIDECENVILTDELSLYHDQEVAVSFFSFTTGRYTIIIYIGGRYYEGHILYLPRK